MKKYRVSFISRNYEVMAEDTQQAEHKARMEEPETDFSQHGVIITCECGRIIKDNGICSCEIPF